MRSRVVFGTGSVNDSEVSILECPKERSQLRMKREETIEGNSISFCRLGVGAEGVKRIIANGSNHVDSVGSSPQEDHDQGLLPVSIA